MPYFSTAQRAFHPFSTRLVLPATQRSCDKESRLRVTGKIVRFDDVRGYGFVTPDIGGDDVFLHVNDLEIDKPLAKSGARVSFEIEEGARGKFATAVRLANGLAPTSPRNHINDNITAASDDDYYDVLSDEELLHAVTEMLLQVTPPLAGDQIVQVRSSFEQLARKQGWIESS